MGIHTCYDKRQRTKPEEVTKRPWKLEVVDVASITMVVCSAAAWGTSMVTMAARAAAEAYASIMLLIIMSYLKVDR